MCAGRASDFKEIDSISTCEVEFCTERALCQSSCCSFVLWVKCLWVIHCAGYREQSDEKLWLAVWGSADCSRLMDCGEFYGRGWAPILRDEPLNLEEWARFPRQRSIGKVIKAEWASDRRKPNNAQMHVVCLLHSNVLLRHSFTFDTRCVGFLLVGRELLNKLQCVYPWNWYSAKT